MLAALALAALQPMTQPLLDFLKKPDASFAVREAGTVQGLTRLELTSQTWQGRPWRHTMLVAEPAKNLKPDSAILLVSGDLAARDYPEVRRLSELSGLTVAALFDVPNQPLWDLREDALIAHTFQQYLATGDASWPLLFPMTKSAIRAMDAVELHSKGRVKHFVVTGASKRGWTAWLAGASGDKRIKGIAPMVFDILNMPAQIEHQKKAFEGQTSEQIRDYAVTGLIDLAQAPDGEKLVRMVDPYSHRDRITMPKLIILGSNDRYWTADAHRLYWDQLKGPKLLRIVPNVGHDLGDGAASDASLAFFARAVLGVLPGGLPRSFRAGISKGEPLSKLGDPRIVAFQAWTALSDTLDFRDSRYSVWTQRETTRRSEATFLEYVLEEEGLRASFTSPMTVTDRRQERKKAPH